MAFGVAAPVRCRARRPVRPGRGATARASAYLDAMRAVVAQGELDILLTSASNGERLAADGSLDDDDHARRPGQRHHRHLEQPRQRLPDAALAPVPHAPTSPPSAPFCDLVLYSVTFNNDLDHDLATLEAYRAFRERGRRARRAALPRGVQPQRARPAWRPTTSAAFVNDSIVRTLAGVTARAAAAVPEDGLQRGGRAGRAGRARPARWWSASSAGRPAPRGTPSSCCTGPQPHGGRVALFGRKIQRAESQLDLVGLMRPVLRGELQPGGRRPRLSRGARQGRASRPSARSRPTSR